MAVTFEQFVAAASPRLVRAARLLLGGAAEAEDMAQETLIVMHQHWPRLCNPDAAQSYAYRTLVRLTRRHVRSARVRHERAAGAAPSAKLQVADPLGEDHAAAVAVVVNTTDPSASHPSPQPSTPDPRDREALLVAPPLSEQCTPWTFAQAQSSAPFSVMLPHVPLADPSSLTHVWNCSADVTEQFVSGITIEFETNTIADPAKAWRRLAASDSEEASVGTVQGQPAALIKPSAGAVGSVTFVRRDTIIRVIGDGSASLQDLIDVADSLTP